MLDHQNLLFLVIGFTICLTLCQWYKNPIITKMLCQDVSWLQVLQKYSKHS